MSANVVATGGATMVITVFVVVVAVVVAVIVVPLASISIFISISNTTFVLPLTKVYLLVVMVNSLISRSSPHNINQCLDLTSNLYSFVEAISERIS